MNDLLDSEDNKELASDKITNISPSSLPPETDQTPQIISGQALESNAIQSIEQDMAHSGQLAKSDQSVSTFPENKELINTDLDREPRDSKKRIIKSVFLLVIVLLVAGNAGLGYPYFQKIKDNKEQKAILTNKSNCPACETTACPPEKICETAPVATETPASATPAISTTKKNTTSYSSTAQEIVVTPPAPPAD